MRDALVWRRIQRKWILIALVFLFLILCFPGVRDRFRFPSPKQKSKFAWARSPSTNAAAATTTAAAADAAVSRPRKIPSFHSDHGARADAASVGNPKALCKPAVQNRRIKSKFKNPHLAICFAGGIREFDLSGLSLVRHVLDYYDARVSFFNIPLDEHTHKISVFLKTKSNLVLNVVSQTPLNETIARLLFNPDGSPNAFQGLLQYFELVEGCNALIRTYQKTYRSLHLKYVFRSRPDSFWNRHPPAISKLVPGNLIFAHGSEFGGINDRISFGDLNQSMLSFQRLSTLPQVWEKGSVGLNSEQTLLKQLQLQGIRIGKDHFPFCVLTRRTYSFFVRNKTTPVGNIGDKRAYLNGIKCRPCIPAAAHKRSQWLLKRLNKSWGAVGTNNDLELCDARMPWPSDWEELFDSLVDEETAQMRKHIKHRSYRTCVEENRMLITRVESYTGPPPSVLCIVGFWGPFHKLHPDMDDWYILSKGLSPGSVVYSFGIGKNLSWEHAVAHHHGCKVHIFDCTPTGRTWAELTGNHTHLRFHDVCIGQYDGWKIFHAVKRKNQVDGGGESDYYTGIKYPFHGFQFVGDPVRAPTFTLAKIILEFSHAYVDLVKIDIGEEVISVVLKDWQRSDDILPVCQLLIDFHWPHLPMSKSVELKTRVMKVLERKSMDFAKCFGQLGAEKCIFVSRYVCNL